jgi:hypothetical protein
MKIFKAVMGLILILTSIILHSVASVIFKYIVFNGHVTIGVVYFLLNLIAIFFLLKNGIEFIVEVTSE